MSARVVIGAFVACVSLVTACGDDANDRSSLPLLANRVAASSGRTGDSGDSPSLAAPAVTEAGATESTDEHGDEPDGTSIGASTTTTTTTTTTNEATATTIGTTARPTTTTVPGATTTTTARAGPTTTVAATIGVATTTSTTTAATTTTSTPTTSTPTTTTLPPPIQGGRYRVPDEVAYGVYRAGPYWATLDAEDVTVNSDIVDVCLSVMVVDERASFVEIEGEARRVEAVPTYDPIAAGCTNGTYLVGPDLAPGRYRLLAIDGFAYWARLDRTLEVIESALVEEDATITIAGGDFALTYTGTLQRL